MITNSELQPHELEEFLARMARRYFSADALSDTESPERIAARVMSAGTYRDVCELIDLAGRAYLAHVFVTAPYHWFSQPAREYWQRHLRLGPPMPRTSRAKPAAPGGAFVPANMPGEPDPVVRVH